jgi:hypothetical protein
VEHVDDQHEPTPDNDNDNDRALEALDTDIDIDGPDVLDDSAVPFDVGQDDLPTRIAHAKQRHGVAGAMLAAGMLGVDQVLNGRKPREEAPIVVDANGEPVDIDRDGIDITLDDAGVQVSAPPLPRTAPVTSPPRRSRWRTR